VAPHLVPRPPHRPLYTILPSVFVQGSFMVQQRLDREQWLNRILVDLVKMF
jgi:hypothetical protein